MNIKKHKSKKVILIIIVTLIICAILGLFLSVHLKPQDNTSRPVNDVDYSEATQDEIDTGKAIKKNNASSDPNQVGSDRAPQATPNLGEDKAVVPITITASTQNGSLVQVRALISAITNSGKCSITFSKDGQSVTETSDIQSLPSSSTCSGFNIPTSNLSLGVWRYTLTFENDTMKGKAEGSITVVET